MSLQVPPAQVDRSQPHVPVIKANESSGCLDALISKIWSCVQAVLNFLTCGCFSSSSKQESVGSPVDPSRVQQLSQQGENGGGSETSTQSPLQEPESDPSGSFSEVEPELDDFSADGTPSYLSDEENGPNGSLVKETGDINADTLEAVERQTRLKDILAGWKETLDCHYYDAEETLTGWGQTVYCYHVHDKRGDAAKLLVDRAESLINDGANLYQCDPNGAFLKGFVDSILGNAADLQQVEKSELKMVSMLLKSGVQLERQDLVIVLSKAIKSVSYSTGARKLIKLFIKERTGAIVDCDQPQQLLALAAMQVNYAKRKADRQLEVLTMLLNAGLQIKGADLKQILWSALQQFSKDHCRELVIEFITKRRGAVLECDPNHDLFKLATSQAKMASGKAKTRLELIVMSLRSLR